MDYKSLVYVVNVSKAEQKLAQLMDDYSELFDQTQSKHSLEGFCETYKNEEKVEELFYKLRGLSERLSEIHYFISIPYED